MAPRARYWMDGGAARMDRIAISDSQAACINFSTSVIHARDVGRSPFQYYVGIVLLTEGYVR